MPSGLMGNPFVGYKCHVWDYNTTFIPYWNYNALFSFEMKTRKLETHVY